MNSCVLRLPLNWMAKNAESMCRTVCEKLKRLDLHAFIIPSATKWARIAPPNSLKDSYTRFLPKTQQYLISRTQTPKCKQYILHYRSITCLNTLVGSVRYLITLLKQSLFYYIVEVYLILLHCWAIQKTLIHCWAIPSPNTLLRHTLSYYIAKPFPNTITLLSYIQS